VADACSTPAYRQFDFWIGDWTAYTAGGADIIARIKVSAVADGCGLLEEVVPTKGPPSEALMVYDPEATLWRREAIAGDGQTILMQGGLQNGELVLEGDEAGGPQHGLARLSWKVQGEVVTESGERSPNGREWNSWFDWELRRTR
jgi:hypothetical protein